MDPQVLVALISTIGTIVIAVVKLNGRINRAKASAAAAQATADEHAQRLDKYEVRFKRQFNRIRELEDRCFKLEENARLMDRQLDDADRYEGEAEAHIDDWERVGYQVKHQLVTRRPVRRKRVEG